MFPVIASVGLFSLFLVFTFFKEYVTVIFMPADPCRGLLPPALLNSPAH